jgi:thiol-disulfide isomerase/thioredoxin
VSDQDDPDVIEQAPRFSFPRMPWRPSGPRTPARGKPAVLAAAVVACALLAVAGSFAVLRLTSSGPADPLAELVTEVTTVPVGHPAPDDATLPTLPPTSPGTSAYSSSLQIEDIPVAVSGPRLTKAGRPEVLYVGAGYCPYCAEENWALIVALSRFGRFTGLATSRSPRFEGVAPIDGWTFYGSSYTSPYLAFVPVETFSNVLVSPKANPGDAPSYRALQRLTPAQQAVFDKYDSQGSTPFIDFANEAAQTGSGILPSLLAGKTWQQIAAALRQPNTPLGAALLNEANTLTAELCRLAGGRPVAVCPS